MIAVATTKRTTHVWITQDYGSKACPTPMIIPKCQRCFGIFIFWEKTEKVGMLYSITAMHLPPNRSRSEKKLRNEIFRQLFAEMKSARPYQIVISGGRIDTREHRFLYKMSLRRYAMYLQSHFPNLEICIHIPNQDTAYSNMVLHEDGTVTVTFYSYPKAA